MAGFSTVSQHVIFCPVKREGMVFADEPARSAIDGQLNSFATHIEHRGSKHPGRTKRGRPTAASTSWTHVGELSRTSASMGAG